MELSINNKIFICLNMQLPFKKYINKPELKFKVGLYYNAIDKESNTKCIIYNRHKLNKYRLSQLTHIPGVDITKCVELYKKNGYFRLPKNYLNSINKNIEVEYDIDVIYNNDALKNISFLPNIFEINDDYVVYKIEDGYNIPTLKDLVNNIEILKNKLIKTHTNLEGNLLYKKIIKDIVCFNYDSGRYATNQKPFFECLKGMSIDFLFIGKHPDGFDSTILVNKKTNNWLFINIHELLPNFIANINSNSNIDTVDSKLDMYNKLKDNYPKIIFKNNKIKEIYFVS